MYINHYEWKVILDLQYNNSMVKTQGSNVLKLSAILLLIYLIYSLPNCSRYRKVPKLSDTRKLSCNLPKIETEAKP